MSTSPKAALLTVLLALGGCNYLNGVEQALEAPLWDKKPVPRREAPRQFESELPVLAIGEAEGVIVPPKFGGYVLAQCSRSTLYRRLRFWTPGEQDIRELEAKLPDYVRTHLPASRDSMPLPLESYRRQYVGVEQEERRYIYVNMFPSEAVSVNEATVSMRGRNREGWRRHPVVVCDGGPDYFGVTYDTKAGRFFQISFNGYARVRPPNNIWSGPV